MTDHTPGIGLVLDCSDHQSLADIETPDIETEAARLEDLGARRIRDDHMHEHGTSWILMTDPEGNEFCVCDGGAAS